jgi:rhodanese-related sulfurtransferase
MFQIKSIEADEAMDYLSTNECFLLDVRTPFEHAQKAIPGSVNIPITELHLRDDEIPEDKEVVVYCAHGMRSGKAAHYLMGRGFTKVAHISGGLEDMDLE